MNPFVSRTLGLLGTGVLLLLLTTWGNGSEVTKQFGLAYIGYEDSVDPAYMGSIGNPSVGPEYDSSASPGFTDGAYIVNDTQGFADPNPWYLYDGIIAPEAMSEAAWDNVPTWNPQDWEPGLVDSFEGYPTGYDIYSGDYTAADMWAQADEREWDEIEHEPGYGDELRTTVYPVYSDSTYYADDLVYTGGSYYYEYEEPAWYEEIVPVSSMGCTYFGWCSTPKTVSTYSVAAPNYTHTAPSYTYTAAQPSYTTYQPAAPTNPTCDITVSPSAISEGEGVTLMWTADNAVAVYNETGSKVGSSGIQGIRPTETHTYQLTVYGSNGSVNRCQTTVQVKQDAPLSCSIAARQKKIEEGSGVELVWSAPSAQRASISGIGEVSYSGAQMVYPNKTTTYELRVMDREGKIQSCTTQVEVVASQGGDDGWFDFNYGGFGGSLDDLVASLDGRRSTQSTTQTQTQTTVTTSTQPPVYVPPPVVPECRVTALPQRIEAGNSVYLEWAMPNDANGYIQGIGYISGSGFQTVTPQQTSTYTLTVQSPRGTRTCAAVVEVAPQAPHPSCVITANPAQVSATQKTALSWTSQNALSAELLGAGAMAPRGSTQVLPGFTRTYTLRVVGQSGKTAVCNATVAVPQPQAGATSASPSCTITASPSVVPTGGKTTLTWSARNASGATMNNGVGSVGLSGNKEVMINQATTYNLTVSDATGKRTQCSATVQVETSTSCALVCGGQTYICAPAPTAQVCGTTSAQPNVQLTSQPLGGSTGNESATQEDSGNWFTNLFTW